MPVVVLMQNDSCLGVYTSIVIAQAFAFKDYITNYQNSGRPMEDFNYRYLGFEVNTDTRGWEPGTGPRIFNQSSSCENKS